LSINAAISSICQAIFFNLGYFEANYGFARSGGFFCGKVGNEQISIFFISGMEKTGIYSEQNSIYNREPIALPRMMEET
jgi:hypothetical protein